jgi:hypothetical protein
MKKQRKKYVFVGKLEKRGKVGRWDSKFLLYVRMFSLRGLFKVSDKVGNEFVATFSILLKTESFWMN